MRSSYLKEKETEIYYTLAEMLPAGWGSQILIKE
jgi:hypothetical protein